jgi:hypothetical protein
LAWRILIEEGDDDIRAFLRLPESYYLGADVTYIFMALNGLMPWNDQKYKLEEQIYNEYPRIREEFLKGEFPEDILDRFRALLEQVGKKPLIVRSSSLLEDNFGTSFAGKYESYFCPNQGDPEQNLHDLTGAIIRIYASMLTPDALLYRRSKGLQDYDERMAILIQVVQGEAFGRYFLPHAAGVAFSRNLYRWSPQIRREDGFLRLVWGLGTRAVDRVGNDYPRLVALSHPLLRPETSARSISLYSQQFVDLIDLQDNQFKTVPVSEVLKSRYPVLRYLAQVDEGDYLAQLHILMSAGSEQKLVITFDELLRRTPLAKRMTRMLQILERNYSSPVDTEFTLRVVNPDCPKPEVEIVLLQCRPQSHLKDSGVNLPKNLADEDIIFSTSCMAPEGRIDDIHYVIFVSPEGYFALTTPTARAKLSRIISLLNAILKDDGFICVGPGRWGTSTPDLGVQIGYADIYHARALVELTGRGIGPASEPSFGTHFFQDLIESNIYPLAIDLDAQDTIFKREFFYALPNELVRFLPDQIDIDIENSLRLIQVADFRPGYHLTVVMDDLAGKSVAYLEADL